MANYRKPWKAIENDRKPNHFLVAKELEDQRLWEDPGARQMSASSCSPVHPGKGYLNFQVVKQRREVSSTVGRLKAEQVKMMMMMMAMVMRPILYMYLLMCIFIYTYIMCVCLFNTVTAENPLLILDMFCIAHQIMQLQHF